MGVRSQLLCHQADIFIGLIVPGRNVCISHQGANVGDGAVCPGVFLQPGYQLSNQVPPADPQAAGAQLLQERDSALGKLLVCGVVVLTVFHQDAALDGAGRSQPFQQPGLTGARFMNRDFNDSQFSGFGQHPADQGPGYPEFLRDIALLLLIQIVAPRHIGEPFLLFSFHKHAPYPDCVLHMLQS